MEKIEFYEIFAKAVERSLLAAMEAVKFLSVPLEFAKENQEEVVAEAEATEEVVEKTGIDFTLKYKSLAIPLHLQMRSLTNNFRKMHGQPLRRRRYGGPRRQRRHK